MFTISTKLYNFCRHFKSLSEMLLQNIMNKNIDLSNFFSYRYLLILVALVEKFK